MDPNAKPTLAPDPQKAEDDAGAPTMPANPTLRQKPEPTKADEEALRARREVLQKQIDANELAHRDLLAERHALDQQLRDIAINAAADEFLGPIPDLQPVTGVETPEDRSRKVTFRGRELPVKTVVYGILSIVAGAVMFPMFAMTLGFTLYSVARGTLTSGQVIPAIVLLVTYAGLMLLMALGLIQQGGLMLGGHTRDRVRLCNGLLLVAVALFIVHLTVFGVGNALFYYGLVTALLVLIHGYFEPEIALERYNEFSDKKTLRQMLRRDDIERTYLPGKRPGKGYISLTFFNLFWIFTICSVLGLILETIWHMVVVDPGVYQDRAGMLWGPLSPIYGFGGALMTIFLNRLHDKPIWVTFIVSAIVGGAFEYFTSWFMEYAFGITAWDYSGTFLNIDGRTNFMFMCMWGVLGIVWVRLVLPIMLYFMKKIPWSWKYTLTAIFAVLIIFDGVMTLTTLDCWYLREDGVPVQGFVETFCAKHFDNEFMQDRFQSMTMNVKDAARSDGAGENVINGKL